MATASSRKPLLARGDNADAGGYGGTVEEASPQLPEGTTLASSVLTDSPPIGAVAALGTPGWDATAGDEARRPIILIAGPRQSGKSSINNVVFHKLSPHETMYLPSTMHVGPELNNHNEYFEFEVWDMPGDHAMNEVIKLEDGSAVPTEDVMRRCGALIFVVDAGEGVDHETSELLRNIGQRVLAHATDLTIDIFIHKLDGDAMQNADARMETQALAQMESARVLREAGLGSLPVSFHATSIFDTSLFDSVSRVVQRLLPQHEPLKRLLDSVVPMCSLRSAGLFDVVSKLHIAKDSLGEDDSLSGLVGDVLDLVVDVSCIYGVEGAMSKRAIGDAAGGDEAAAAAAAAEAEAEAAAEGDRGGDHYGDADELGMGADDDELQDEEEEDTFQFDSFSESQVILQSGDVLIMHAVGPYLALVGVANSEEFTAGSVQGAFSANMDVLRKAIKSLFRPVRAVSAALHGARDGSAPHSLMLPPPAEAGEAGSVVSAAGSINA